MPTILAVDDSATMRKAYEITFTGTEFDLAAVGSFDDAIAALEAKKPDLVLADASLEPRNGYDLADEIKQRFPGTPVVIVSSTQNPFDAGKGANADDHMDKPFDTQALIDKARRICGGENVSQTTRPLTPTSSPRAMSAPPNPPSNPGLSAAPQRAPTLSFTPGAGVPSTPPRGSGAPAPPKPSISPAATMAGVGFASPAASAMAAKLPELGLSPAQVEAVMALSKDVVERVVWEVVPVLAETLIKEEIARLTK